MAHPQAPPRGSPPMGPPHGGPMGHQGAPRMERIPTNPAIGPQPLVPEQPAHQAEPPPENTYPCGCAWPGTHKQDCMWSLWEQMRDNYLQTRELMGKFMTQANTMQDTSREGVKCECPAGCHGTDLGTAMGLQQMTGVTLPWDTTLGSPMGPGGARGGGGAPPQSYSVENEARKLMEEQKRIKNTWVQFLSIFDMALDMANDVSKDRWEQNRRRKERQRLEREQRLEEMRKERLERQKGSKPEPPPEKEKVSDQQDKDEKMNDKEQTEPPKEEKLNKPEETPKEEDKEKEEQTTPEQEETPAEEQQQTEEPKAEENEEGAE